MSYFKFVMTAIIVLMFLTKMDFCYAQETAGEAKDTSVVAVKKQPDKKKPKGQEVYVGGAVGLSFGDYFRISVEPLISYRVTPQLAAGLRLRYEYVRNKAGGTTFNFHNYGASVYGRFWVVPQLYAHAEFALMSYDQAFGSRNTVPFLFLGAGYWKRISKHTWAWAQVAFDVIQDNNSPYSNWEPFISVGVSAGL
ncbi:MAG: hypothetical protein ACE5GL_08315 [Calditrichia bacterium]